MDIHSCKKCGIVVDLDKIEFIFYRLPDDPKDESKRDSMGLFDMDVDTHFNPDCIWPRGDSFPLDTWKCPVCEEFNAKGED